MDGSCLLFLSLFFKAFCLRHSLAPAERTVAANTRVRRWLCGIARSRGVTWRRWRHGGAVARWRWCRRLQWHRASFAVRGKERRIKENVVFVFPTAFSSLANTKVIHPKLYKIMLLLWHTQLKGCLFFYAVTRGWVVVIHTKPTKVWKLDLTW